MRVLFDAEQEWLGHRVALKVSPAGTFTDAEHVRQFERETRSAAHLHHTSIVPVFGMGNHEGTHFYVMQLIQGQGLDTVPEELKQLCTARTAKTTLPARSEHQRLAAGITYSPATGRFVVEGDDQPLTSGWTLPATTPPIVGHGLSLSPADSGQSSSHGLLGVSSFSETDGRFARSVARIGVQVAEALAYAHGQSTLDRDIKPSKLLLDENGNVWVADFGLATATGADDVTHTGDIVGMVRYMAPERFQGLVMRGLMCMRWG
jgi:hypothetical protein